MSVNADAARCRPSFGVGVLVAEGGISPRPAGAYHQRLEVVLASKADRDRADILVVIINLMTPVPAPLPITSYGNLGYVKARQKFCPQSKPFLRL